MNPDPQVASAHDLRTVCPHDTGTPEKTPSLKWTEPTWAERLLMGCSPRVAVLDVWASPEVLLAAKTVGIPYLCPLDKPEPYDCVLSILTKKKHALAFCYSALRAWTSLQPGGTMVLVMREEAFVATRRFWPTPPILVKVVGDETRLAYAWRKPIALKAGTRRTAKKTVAR